MKRHVLCASETTLNARICFESGLDVVFSAEHVVNFLEIVGAFHNGLGASGWGVALL